ncbi:MAG: hypothetical protein ACK5Y2_11225 [Bdellovibrionales bacterium]
MTIRFAREVGNAIRAMQGFYLVLCLENFAKIALSYKEFGAVFKPSVFTGFLHLIPHEIGFFGVQILYIPSMLCAALAPQLIGTRLCAAITQFLLTAYLYGFGFDYHGLLPQMYVCLGLAFVLPVGAGLTSMSERIRFLVSYKIVMFIALLHYTISGLWKLAYAFLLQPLEGARGIFSWDAYAYIATGYLAQSGVEPLLADWAISNSPLMTILFGLAIYVEVFAWVGILRPATAKVFAIGLLGMHTFALFTLGINFKDSIPIIIFFLFLHPTEVKYSLLDGIRELPILRQIINRLFRGFTNA